jgi:hypothetical protein
MQGSWQGTFIHEGVLICLCLDGMGQKGAGVSLHVERLILPVSCPDGVDEVVIYLIP